MSGPGYVDVVEQNATSSGTDRFPLNGSRVTANGYTPIIGWLRETEQTPVELTASSVAGTPQSVSDQPGDMDVIWRGTDAKLHDLAYRNEAWQTQSAVAAITPANVASDPAVVSPAAGPGRRLLGGHRSVTSGRSSRRAAISARRRGCRRRSCRSGTLALGSAPTAVSQGPGEMEVIWKSDRRHSSGSTRFTGTWSGADAAELRRGPGQPVRGGDRRRDGRASSGATPRAISGATSARPTAGSAPMKIGTGGLASDPTVVTAGPSATVDADLAHARRIGVGCGVTPNGGPAQVEVDSAVSMGQPAAAGTACECGDRRDAARRRQPRRRDLRPAATAGSARSSSTRSRPARSSRQ